MDKSDITAEQLSQEEWTKRCSLTEPRLSEMVELYRQLGFEVLSVPIKSSDLPREGCRESFLIQYERYKTIYTRAQLPND